MEPKNRHGNNIDQCDQHRKDHHQRNLNTNELLPAPSINNVLAMGLEINFIYHQHDDDHSGEIKQPAAEPAYCLPYFGKAEAYHPISLPIRVSPIVVRCSIYQLI